MAPRASRKSLLKTARNAALFLICLLCALFSPRAAVGDDAGESDTKLYRLNVLPGSRARYRLEVTWEISPQPFKAGELRFIGTIRMVNKEAATLPLYLRGVALGIRFTDPQGHGTTLFSDLPDPEISVVPPPPPPPRVFQILEATRNGSPVKPENTEPILLAPGDSFAARLALNWPSVKIDPASALPSVEIIRQYRYELVLPFVAGDSEMQIRHTKSIPLSAHIKAGD